jgi:two-component system, sensor histidine kinase and response regulator
MSVATTPAWKRIPRAVAASAALDFAPFGVIWVDDDGLIAYTNKSVEAQLGHVMADVLGKPISILATFWSTSDWKDRVWDRAASTPLTAIDGKWHSKNGAPVAFSASVSRVQVAGQEIAVIYLQPAREAQFDAKAADKIPDFIDALGTGIAIVDGALTVRRANPALGAIVGIEASNLVGRSIAQLLPSEEDETSRWPLLTSTGLHDWSLAFRGPTGRPMNLAISSRALDVGNSPCYVIVVEDHSEHMQLKRMLEQHEHSFETMAANAPGMIYKFTLSPDGKASFPYASPGAKDIWEVDPAEVMHDAAPIVRLIHPDDIGPFQQSVMDSATTLSRWEFEGRMITPSGKLKWFHAASRPELADNGDIVWQGLLMDISHQKVIEDELKIAKEKAESAARSKAEFLANMSHEIRTPMNGVIGMAELLINIDLPPRPKHYVETIRSSAEVLLAILNDILDISKMEAGKLSLHPASFDLRRTLDDVAMLLAPSAFGKGLEFIVRYDAQAPAMVYGDAVRIRQILTNLIGNAIKFTAEGHVLVSVEPIAKVSNDVTLRFSIRDTGIGISDEAMKRLFQNFEQAESSTSRKFGGTGLGLAISKQLVEIMGGSIEVKSTLGEGSAFTFELTLPISDAVCAAAVFPDFSQVRIIGVDDHPVNREMLSDVFNTWNIKQHAVCESGESALKVLREASKKGRAFQVAVLDFHMPGMDGVMLANAIRAEPEIDDIAIIMLSSSTFTDDQRRILGEAGMVAHLLKPMRQFEMQQAIAAAMEGQSTTPSDSARANVATGLGTTTAATSASGKKATQKSDSGTKPSMTMNPPTTTTPLRVLLAEDNEVNAEIATSMLATLDCEVEVACNGVEAVEKATAQPNARDGWLHGDTSHTPAQECPSPDHYRHDCLCDGGRS